MKEKVESRDTRSPPDSARLHYLDWLRVLAIPMVFLFHAVHPFNFGDWQVKNTEQSKTITIILQLLGIWGMPFFFLVAGAGSWFALQKRTAGQYLRERFNRLLIPFFAGTIPFSPIELYTEWANKVQAAPTGDHRYRFLCCAVECWYVDKTADRRPEFLCGFRWPT